MTECEKPQFSWWHTWGKYGCGVMACALLVCIRVVGLGHYPALHPDEGFWVSGARNAAKFGAPFMDGRLHPFLTPATYVALRALFAFVQPNLMSARAFSVVMGLLSCGLMWILGYQCFRRRPWLLPLLFGTSGFTIAAHRMMLLESHQTFWMILAAVLWLRGGRGSALFSGAAFGVALLVKSNSIFLIPAFIGSAVLRNQGEQNRAIGFAEAQAWKHPLIFLFACAVVAAGGYLFAYSINPADFVTAFRFELDGQHFDYKDALFHVGRFGLNPHLLLQTVIGAFRVEPIIIPLSGISLASIVWRVHSATQADRFFVLWLLLGTLFHLSQIWISPHYLATLAPAGAYLAARLLDSMLDRTSSIPPFGWRRPAAQAAIFVACAWQSVRVGYGIYMHDETDYWQTVQWMTKNAPDNVRVMAAAYIDVSLPQRSYDFFRLARPYNSLSPPRTLESLVDRYKISLIVVDPEWREQAISGSAEFLASRCVVVMSNGRFKVYAVRTLQGDARRQPGP